LLGFVGVRPTIPKPAASKPAAPKPAAPAPPPYIEKTEKARLILRYAVEAREAFQESCDQSRGERRATGGALTDAEQDLLRAMLVFAAAGLDSLVKQLIRDCLRALSGRDRAVQAELQAFVARQLRGDLSADESEAASGRKFLSRVLVAPNPLLGVTEQYITDLTGESMQSPEQLFRAVKALGIDPPALGLDAAILKSIFEARNQMIHEMDIVLESKAKARKRRSRTVEDMENAADYLLGIGARLISAVEQKLAAAP
jgi:hypothetical protein